MERQVNFAVAAAAAVALCFFTISNIIPVAGDNSTTNAADTDSLCAQLIRPPGYICSEHTVKTEDGFLLGVERVSSHNGNYSEGKRGPPVLLLHGLFMGGEAWFLNGINNSLGFLLADKGFDVWVGNIRAVQWSHGHASLSKSDKKFWDWSWPELARYDLPAMLNYVTNITKSKVSVVGHSQGSLMSLVGFINNATAQKVEAAGFLCPATYVHWLTARLARFMTILHADEAAVDDGVISVDLKNNFKSETVQSLCSDYTCHNMVKAITGTNCCFDVSKVNQYLRYDPQPTSMKNLAHLAQMVRDGYLRLYDYGMFGNVAKYKLFNPPMYNLSMIPSSLPIWIANGGQDEVVSTTDVRQTLSELRHPQREMPRLYKDNYGHLDFLFSSTVKSDVYDNLIEFLAKRTSHNCTA